jgi:hypothetical protein
MKPFAGVNHIPKDKAKKGSFWWSPEKVYPVRQFYIRFLTSSPGRVSLSFVLSHQSFGIET